MSSTNSIKSVSRILGWILILFLLVVGVVQSGNLANLVDPYGFLFVLQHPACHD
jgi:hypothetical protein